MEITEIDNIKFFKSTDEHNDNNINEIETNINEIIKNYNDYLTLKKTSRVRHSNISNEECIKTEEIFATNCSTLLKEINGFSKLIANINVANMSHVNLIILQAKLVKLKHSLETILQPKEHNYLSHIIEALTKLLFDTSDIIEKLFNNLKEPQIKNITKILNGENALHSRFLNFGSPHRTYYSSGGYKYKSSLKRKSKKKIQSKKKTKTI
jgi:hypothetical protein